jgi:ubiquitin carboxyl-terminal hydrolase 14
MKEKDIVEHDRVLWRDNDDKFLETGDYELVGVITHQGRSSESGHYVGWVQDKGGMQFFFY